MEQKISTSWNSTGQVLGEDLNYSFDYTYAQGYAHRVSQIGPLHYEYDNNGNVIREWEGDREEELEEGRYEVTEEAADVYSTDYGWALENPESSGGNGNESYERTYTWNERNMLIQSSDSLHTVQYRYGQDGQRAIKSSAGSETLYFNSMWSWIRNKSISSDDRVSKNVFLGSTRLVTRLNNDGDSENVDAAKENTYYYHADHLGSAQLVTNHKGEEYERIEYTPYGETWVEKTSPTNVDLPYKFTGKELDEETGLYYYGARYLDPKTSRWLSTDPALAEYIPQAPVNDEAKRANGNLPGMGGIYNQVNFHVYHYAGNNPVKYVDPDGRFSKDTIRGLVRSVVVIPDFVLAAQNGVFPNESVGFSFDSATGLYSTTIDAPQAIFGYNRLYDLVFDLGTSMKAQRFDFTSGGIDYALWAWKGDYLNLGAGMELGIYQKAEGILGQLGHFIVNPSLAMKMTGTLTHDGAEVGSFNGIHWWGTSFNPHVQNVNSSDLAAQFTVQFANEQMYIDFRDTWKGKHDSPWTNFNDVTLEATLSY